MHFLISHFKKKKKKKEEKKDTWKSHFASYWRGISDKKLRACLVSMLRSRLVYKTESFALCII